MAAGQLDGERANHSLQATAIEETARVLNVSPSTAERDWRSAKAWLNRELGSEVRP